MTKNNNNMSYGSNQSNVRAYNERLLMTLIRENGALSKTEIAKKTSLSLQTVSVIMRSLEQEGFLKKGAPYRGKIGQPSVPMYINETGAFFFGLKVGRRSVDIVLIDLLGRIVAFEYMIYNYPTPDRVIKFAKEKITKITNSLSVKNSKKIGGLGIAIPFHLWNWENVFVAPTEEMNQWKERDIKEELDSFFTYPIFTENDDNAACNAELIFGKTNPSKNFLYIYVGFFIGGGIAIDGKLYTGPTKNAGAIGSLLVPTENGEVLQQLINVASISRLEADIKAAGMSSETLWNSPEIGRPHPQESNHWEIDSKILRSWINSSGYSLAHVISYSSAIMDFEEVIIDGSMPDQIRQAIVSETQDKMKNIDLTGVNTPNIKVGSIGPDARVLGAASFPLAERFLVSIDAFRKQ